MINYTYNKTVLTINSETKIVENVYNKKQRDLLFLADPSISNNFTNFGNFILMVRIYLSCN